MEVSTKIIMNYVKPCNVGQ